MSATNRNTNLQHPMPRQLCLHDERMGKLQAQQRFLWSRYANANQHDYDAGRQRRHCMPSDDRNAELQCTLSRQLCLHAKRVGNVHQHGQGHLWHGHPDANQHDYYAGSKWRNRMPAYDADAVLHGHMPELDN